MPLNYGEQMLGMLTFEFYIIGGLEFGDLAGHTLLIFKEPDHLFCVGIKVLLMYVDP
jgi:hypothetical protein